MTPPNVGALVNVQAAPIRASNAESKDLDYSVAVATLRQVGGSQISTPEVVKHNGAYAWQYDFNMTVEGQTSPSRLRAIDFWDGNRLYSVWLRGRPGSAAADFSTMMVIPRTFES